MKEEDIIQKGDMKVDILKEQKEILIIIVKELK